MSGIELEGEWSAAPATDELRRSLADPGSVAGRWGPVTVPGYWQQERVFRDEPGPVAYLHHFTGPKPGPAERWWLVFDALMYQGDVWLDGEYLGDTEGYFVRHQFEVTQPLAARSEHVLVVEVACSPGGPDSRRRGLLGPFEGGTDLVSTANPGGIWGSVRLERSGPVRIRALRAICRHASADRATVACRAVLDASAARSVHLHSTIAGVETGREQPLAAGSNDLEWTIAVPSPARWWPAGWGEQVLHDLVVTVETRAEETSDRSLRRIGLRSVELRDWALHVNGERLFTKGVNLAPVLPGPDSEARLHQELDLARELGANLVRPYGHVAPVALYDAADRIGMLVWQDLPLVGPAAGSIRPQATRQARAMVDQLGHHPSISFWCGHVGPTGEWMRSGHRPRWERVRLLAANELPTVARSIGDRSIKRVLTGHDGSRPTFGYTGVLPHAPRLDASPSHLWFGWRGGGERDLEAFAARFPSQVSFVAELGAQSLPTTGPFVEAEGWPDVDWSRLALRHGMDVAAFTRYVPPVGHPDAPSWIEATQLYQAILVRRQVELLRRLKYRPTGGVCVHFLADHTPMVSSSLVDASGQPKRAYTALAAAYAPVIVVADRLPNRLQLGQQLDLTIHVVSDLQDPLTAAVVDAEMVFPEETQQWRFGGDVPIDACVRVGRLQVTVPATPGDATLHLRLSGPAEATNRYDATVR